jgi:outer membrane protein OmpA-like peptidoglycan-associated protein
MQRIASLVAVVIAMVAGVGVATHASAQATGLTLHPGVTVNFSIYGGYSSAGQLLGDYDFVNQVTGVSGGGYTYNFWFTGPAPTSGFQVVAPGARQSGTILREFWPNGNMSALNYVSFLAISNASYADLKAGKPTPLIFNGPGSPVSLIPVGEEDLTTMVNEHQVTLHTIKTRGAAGGFFWIVDDPAFPMVIKGQFKWSWMATAIGDPAFAGPQLVSALSAQGEATTHAILFAFDSAVLDREATPVLDDLAQYLRANPKVRLEIQGHTDSVGGAAPNLALSQARAESVGAYLSAAGVSPSRLRPKGYGLTVPVADNATPEGRAQNRRVVFRALSPGGTE